MIFDASTLPLPLHLRADLCVVGSGAGGAAAAMVAAEAGLRVVVLEAGELVTPARMTQREEQMFPRLYWDNAGRTTADRYVKIHQGHGVGGSTLHNINLCKRIPDAILSRWQEERGLAYLPPSAWHALYDEVETLLSVAPVPKEMWNRHNRLLEAGCQSLGWAGGGLRHNRTGCLGSGFCELGCHYDAKNNAAKVLIPRAVAAGAEVIARAQAVRLVHDGRRVTGVSAVALAPETHAPLGAIDIEATEVCVSASATASPALLLRSRVPDPSESCGKSLRIHPGVMAAGDFAEPVTAWIGIPQAYECTEYLDLDEPSGHRLWIIPAFAHPVGAASLLPGHGPEHRQVLERYAHMGAFSAMLHDETRGTIMPKGDLGLSIDYWPNAADRRELALGLWATVHLLFAAGAKRVFVPTSPLRIIERGQNYDDLKQLDITRGLVDITAVHPMGSLPMGDDPRAAALDSRGKHHHVDGLWVADGSLFPTSIGVPPQLSIYSLGLHVGRQLVAVAGSAGA